MNTGKRFFAVGALSAVLAVMMFLAPTPASSAVLLNTGGAVVPSDDTGLLGTLTQLDFVSNAATPLSQTFGGFLDAGVFSDASGNMVFAYQTRNQPGVSASDDITRVTGVSFTGFITSVGYITGVPLGSFQAGTVNPTSADRNVAGNTVGFDFASGVPSGSNSAVLLVFTNANWYTRGFVSELDGGSYTGMAFAPTNVPEPTTFALIGGALIGLACARRKKGSQA